MSLLKRLYNMFIGFFGLFVKGVEKNNPEALLENAKENLRKQIAHFNSALANHAAMVEQLLGKAKQLETEEADLRAKVKGLLEAGKRDLAATLAVRLQSADTQHDAIVAQLTEAETQYKELTKARDISVRGATKKIEELTVGINDLKVKRAAAELTEMATGMISNIGSNGDDLARISELVNDERNKAAGRVRVAQDSTDLVDVAATEVMEQALAAQALAKIEAEMGLSNPSCKSITNGDDPIEVVLKKSTPRKKKTTTVTA